MPELHGLTVRVTDRHGNNLPEWGIHHLRHTNRVSAYIQSTTNAAFRVSIRPNIPYVGPDLPQSYNKISDDFQHERAGPVRAGPEELCPRTGHNHRHLPLNFIPPPCPEKAAVPPYSFVAALYLDGRTEPERKIVIYTDPDDDDFEQPDGKAWFKYRWTQTSDGKIAEHGWIFKDKAIEWEFNRLDVSAALTALKEQSNDGNGLVDAMQSTGFGVHATAQDERSKVGQILVEISRITLGAKYSEDNYLPALKEEKDDDINMDDLGGEITHATAFVRKTVSRPKPVRVVDFSPYRKGEGVYASFQFFYRSEEQLQKFAFPGFPTKPKISVKSWRQLNGQMADLTPLSLFQAGISKPKNPLHKAKETYEERVKNRSFKTGENPKHDFGLEYRDILQGAPTSAATLLKFYGHSTSAIEVNSTPREGSGFAMHENRRERPANSLPFIDRVLKATRSERTSNIHDNPGKHPKATVPFVQESYKEQMQLIRYPTFGGDSSDTSSSGPFLQSGDNHLEFRSGTVLATEADGPLYNKTRNRSYSDTTSQLSKPNSTKEATINTSDPITTASPSSSSPSATPNTPFYVSVNLRPFTVSEDIADIVSAARSDYESYPAHTNLRYTANPDEDGAVHQGIRSLINHVGYQKRRHAEVESTEDAGADGSGRFTASENNGSASQSEQLAPLGRIEDENHNPPGKKVRFSGLGPCVNVSGTKAQVVEDADPDAMVGILSDGV